MDKSLSLQDGGRIILEDVIGKPISGERKQRNIYRLSANGDTVWRVSGPEDDDPYTNVYFTETGLLMGYNWNGGEYQIDAETGKAVFKAFLK